jgi:hypothetical protein
MRMNIDAVPLLSDVVIGWFISGSASRGFSLEVARHNRRDASLRLASGMHRRRRRTPSRSRRLLEATLVHGCIRVRRKRAH